MKGDVESLTGWLGRYMESSVVGCRRVAGLVCGSSAVGVQEKEQRGELCSTLLNVMHF